MIARKMEKPNNGIKCAVKSCEYHMSGDHCAADKIQVETTTNSTKADCSTFIPKDKMY